MAQQSSSNIAQPYAMQTPENIEIVGAGLGTSQLQPGFATVAEPIPQDYAAQVASPKAPTTAFTNRVVLGTWRAEQEEFLKAVRDTALEWTQEFAWEASAAAELDPQVMQRLGEWKRARENVLAIKAAEIEAEWQVMVYRYALSKSICELRDRVGLVDFGRCVNRFRQQQTQAQQEERDRAWAQTGAGQSSGTVADPVPQTRSPRSKTPAPSPQPAQSALPQPYAQFVNEGAGIQRTVRRLEAQRQEPQINPVGQTTVEPMPEPVAKGGAEVVRPPLKAAPAKQPASGQGQMPQYSQTAMSPTSPAQPPTPTSVAPATPPPAAQVQAQEQPTEVVMTATIAGGLVVPIAVPAKVIPSPKALVTSQSHTVKPPPPMYVQPAVDQSTAQVQVAAEMPGTPPFKAASPTTKPPPPVYIEPQAEQQPQRLPYKAPPVAEPSIGAQGTQDMPVLAKSSEPPAPMAKVSDRIRSRARSRSRIVDAREDPRLTDRLKEGYQRESDLFRAEPRTSSVIDVQRIGMNKEAVERVQAKMRMEEEQRRAAKLECPPTVTVEISTERLPDPGSEEEHAPSKARNTEFEAGSQHSSSALVRTRSPNKIPTDVIEAVATGEEVATLSPDEEINLSGIRLERGEPQPKARRTKRMSSRQVCGDAAVTEQWVSTLGRVKPHSHSQEGTQSSKRRSLRGTE